MQSLRLNALHELFSNSKILEVPESKQITTFFGENVFTLKKAREFLSDEAYKSLVSSIKNQTKIDNLTGVGCPSISESTLRKDKTSSWVNKPASSQAA